MPSGIVAVAVSLEGYGRLAAALLLILLDALPRAAAGRNLGAAGA